MDEPKVSSRIANAYFREVGEYSLPSKEEERRLFTEYKALKLRLESDALNADERRTLSATKVRVGQKIACYYLRFVIKQARARTKDETLLQELISEGNIGLMVGVERFDVDVGVRFLTYAANWINVYMQEHLNKLSQVHVPNHTRKEMRRVRISEEKLIAKGVLTAHSIEEPVTTSLEPSIHPSTENVEQDVMRNELNLLKVVQEAKLNRLEKLIVVYYFGLRGGAGRTFQELSETIKRIDGSDVPVDKIRQIKDKSIGVIKRHLAEHKIHSLRDLV